MGDYEMNGAPSGNDSMSEFRRRYPKDTSGIKDEWRAIIKHQTEINEMIAKREKELKALKQQELGKDYDYKLQEQIKMKEHELMLKRHEANEVQAKVERYKMDVMKQKEDKNLVQHHLAEDYSQRIMTKQQIEQLQRERKLEEEKRMIEESQRRLEEAKKKQLVKQQEHYQIFHEEIKRAEEKNHKLLEDKIKEKLDYRDLITQNEKQQLLKEENYKNFFKLSVEHQKQLMDLHAQNVLFPYVEKQKNIEEIVDKRIDEVRERQLIEEIRRRKAREEKTFEVGNSNKEIFGYKDHVKNMEKAEKEAKIQESLKQSMEYQDFLKNMKAQKFEKQRAYKEFLDKQTVSQAERQLLNKMTKEEKKLNFNDLQAYKQYDPKLFALVPGFINSKYANPIGGPDSQYAKATKTSNIYDNSPRIENNQQQAYENNQSSQDSPYKAQAQSPITGNNNTSADLPQQNYASNYKAAEALASPKDRRYEVNDRQYEQARQERQYDAQPSANQAQYGGAQQYAAQQYAAQERQYATQGNFQREPAAPQYNSNLAATQSYDKFNSIQQQAMMGSPNQRSSTDINAYFKKPHNPITNPLPFNVQNPYIAKEMNKVIQTKQPYFANMASNNLLG